MSSVKFIHDLTNGASFALPALIKGLWWKIVVFDINSILDLVAILRLTLNMKKKQGFHNNKN